MIALRSSAPVIVIACSDCVPPTTSLNLWCCNLSGGILGYAQFPTVPAGTVPITDIVGWGGSANTDGVVAAFAAAQGAFTVLEWIAKAAKPFLFIAAVVASISVFIQEFKAH